MSENLFSLWVYLSTSPLTGLTATLIAYQIGLSCAKAANSHPLVNPVLVAIILLAAGITVAGIPYRQYFEGAQFIHFMLGTATVALAIPFVDRLKTLRAVWAPFSLAIIAGSLAGTLCAVLLAWLFGIDRTLILSLIPKSVTAPIAMGISERIGGLPALSAVFCILTGIIGAASGRLLFDALGIRSMLVRGLALGSASHGIGTARAYFVNQDAGAFAGLALAIHGVIAALVIPPLVLWATR